MLVGKLTMSSVVDAAGWAGKNVPITSMRAPCPRCFLVVSTMTSEVVAMCMVLVGTMLFSVKSWRQLLKHG